MAPPRISIKPQRCPQAVIEWYSISGLEDRKESLRRKDLALKAKQHLCALGWTFWYIAKKGRWELRYTSPKDGKNYVSLRKACESCIADGLENDHLVHQTTKPLVHPPQTKKRPRRRKKIIARESTSSEEEEDSDSSTSTVGYSEPEPEPSSSAESESEPEPEPSSSSEPEPEPSSSSESEPEPEPPSSVDGKRVKVLRIRLRKRDCEAHEGCTRHRPSSSIFLKDGRSCQREALSSLQQENVRQHNNDSLCSVCREGGDIIMCDGCPSSFHMSCIGLDRVPDGDWFCPRCSCKICNRPRCREGEEEECAAGADHDMDNCTLACAQCEQRCHLGCLRSIGFTFTNVESHPNKNWSCSVACRMVFFNLQKLLGNPIPVGAGNLTWTLLKAVCSDNGGALELPYEGSGQNESKLRLALGVLHGCFGPVIHAVSGRDVILDIVFSRGSEQRRLNFRGFCTVILEKNKEVISVATVRIYGQKVAEIAFVATKEHFRKRGMCRLLMNELEKQLTRLGVGSMVLHSSPNAIDTWTNSFAFARMTTLDQSQYLDCTFLEFDDTILCHKPLMKFAG